MTTTWAMPPTPPEFDGTAHVLVAAERELAALQEASPRDASAVERMRRAATSLHTAVREYDEHAHAISQDQRLSDHGRSEKRAGLQQLLRESVHAAVKTAEDTAQQLEASSAWSPPTLTDDPMLAEAQLQTARLDAAQLLQNVADKDMADELRDIVQDENTPAPLRHLLLFTSWPQLFMRGRGVHESMREAWTRYQDILARDALPEPARAAHQRHHAVRRHAPKAAMVIHHAGHFALADRGVQAE